MKILHSIFLIISIVSISGMSAEKVHKPSTDQITKNLRVMFDKDKSIDISEKYFKERYMPYIMKNSIPITHGDNLLIDIAIDNFDKSNNPIPSFAVDASIQQMESRLAKRVSCGSVMSKKGAGKPMVSAESCSIEAHGFFYFEEITVGKEKLVETVVIFDGVARVLVPSS